MEKTITLKSINDSSSFNYKIYEGERKLLQYNVLFGKFTLNNISKKKGEDIEIEIIFRMGINYNLFGTVNERRNDNKNTIEIKYDNNYS